jgi:hypothetical protein
MTSDTLGLYLVIALYFVGAVMILMVRLPQPVKLILFIGVLLRPLGAGLRYGILQYVYHGSGDASKYFGRARSYAPLFWDGNFHAFVGTLFGPRGTWQGTRFIQFVTSIVVAVIGPTKLGTFLFFAIFPTIGLLAFALAFSRACPGASVSRYLFWILLFPSLWYWPSSIGKESVVLMGMGLATMGFVGKQGRINWLVMGLGLFLIYAIRPEVAAVTVGALSVSHWLSFAGNWNAARVVQAAVIGVVSVVGLAFFLQSSGVEQLDAEGLTSYVEGSTGRKLEGGSGIEAVNVGLTGIPVAFVNIMFRPFPWEANNFLMLLSALEIGMFWGILWYRRANVLRAVREWRSNRLLRIALPFTILYAIALGMMLSNLGIIARQRVFLFPFLFLVAEALPRTARAPARAWSAMRTDRPSRIARRGPEEAVA